jgi:hypothetical protein
MRRPTGFLAGLACGAGALLAFRWRRRRRPAEAAAPDPAEELKRKLEESRAEGAETSSEREPGQVSEAGVDERRRDVHDRGRDAIERMREGMDTAGDR